MKRSRILIISFLALLLVALFYFFGLLPMSMVPGWHTVIYPPYYPWLLIVILTLFFGTIGYWLYIKRISRLNRVLFIIYAVVTSLIYIFLKFPYLPLKFLQDEGEALFRTARNIVLLLPIANWVLIITQILFVAYVGCVIMFRRKRQGIVQP